MKKVRIYSLKQTWGLPNCTDILAACKHLGIPAKTASSSIHPHRVSQVQDWLTDPANRDLIPSKTPLAIASKSPKGSKSKKANSKKVSSRKATQSSPETASKTAKTSKKRGKKSHKSQPSTFQTTEVATTSLLEDASFGNDSFAYVNGNRNFRLTVTGLKQQRIRNGLTHLNVPFDRLSHEVQRLHRMEAKILDITLIAPNRAQNGDNLL